MCEDGHSDGVDMTRLTPPQRLSMWVIPRLPRIVVTDTLQVALAFAWLCVGVGSLITLQEPSVANRALVLIALRIEWSVTLILGGAAQIYGLQRESRMWERSGLALAAVGTLTYCFALLASGRPSGYVIAVAFLAFTVGYVIRMMASTVTRIQRFP